jgi:hypothetical protein
MPAAGITCCCRARLHAVWLYASLYNTMLHLVYANRI